MKDQDAIIAQLKSRATDPEHEQALTDLCRQLIEQFENKSSQGVTVSITAEIGRLREAYNTAYAALMEKMDLNPGGSR